MHLEARHAFQFRLCALLISVFSAPKLSPGFEKKLHPFFNHRDVVSVPHAKVYIT